jgi:four helix bundle protein
LIAGVKCRRSVENFNTPAGEWRIRSHIAARASRTWAARRLPRPVPVGVRRVEDLVVYQLSVQFRRAVYHLVRQHPSAGRDLRYRDQLFDAVLSASANVAEGLGRQTTRDFSLFLSYAQGSVAESMTRIEDGVDRGHFTLQSVQETLVLGRRTAAAIAELQKSLRPFMKSNHVGR